MKRRDFLHTAAVAGALSSLPAMAQAAAAAAPPRLALARAAAAEAGAVFEPFPHAHCSDCGSAAVRVRLDGLHLAHGEPVLREFSLAALFDHGSAGPSPFHAWQYVHAAVPHRSQRLAFVAARDGMRGFALEYRLDGDRCAESCALASFELPLLAPGHYVITGPRRHGGRVETAALRHSGDASAPLGFAHRDFDYFAFRIEALG